MCYLLNKKRRNKPLLPVTFHSLFWIKGITCIPCLVTQYPDIPRFILGHPFIKWRHSRTKKGESLYQLIAWYSVDLTHLRASGLLALIKLVFHQISTISTSFFWHFGKIPLRIIVVGAFLRGVEDSPITFFVKETFNLLKILNHQCNSLWHQTTEQLQWKIYKKFLSVRNLCSFVIISDVTSNIPFPWLRYCICIPFLCVCVCVCCIILYVCLFHQTHHWCPWCSFWTSGDSSHGFQKQRLSLHTHMLMCNDL